MSLSFFSRRLPESSLTIMEGQECGAVGGEGPEGGLWGPLRVGAFTLCGSCSSAELFSFVRQGECSPGGDSGVDHQKGAV